MNADYQAFLRAKARIAEQSGFYVDVDEVNPALKPHIRAIVPWMLQGGRRGLFARFGMQKTTAHLECMRLVMKRIPGRPTLIAMPLGARLSFFRDAETYFQGAYSIRIKFIRSNAEIDPAAINLTNFESIREGKVNPGLFSAASLDEGDILRSFGGTKTFREFMRLFEPVQYRFVATATPDPNDYVELLAYADWLGVMETSEAKTRFFKRDSTKADRLTIHPHKEREFWLWVASWALFLQKPSDLGPQFSDEGYDLPALDIRWHEVPTNHFTAAANRDGHGTLFKNAATSLADAAHEKRDSMAARIAKVMEIRAEQPDAHRILWHNLEDERRALEKAIPGLATAYGNQDIEDREAILMDFAEGRIPELGGKPMQIGAGGNYQAYCWWAIFAGIDFKFKDIIQAIHRIQRYGQRFHGWQPPEGTRQPYPPPAVRLDFIYSEAERDIRRVLLEKWARYEEQAARMSALIREHGLAHQDLATVLQRSIGVERVEAVGEAWRAINNDCVEETRTMPADSVGLIVTSIPFATQYEYTPSYNDFGHTDDNPHFWRQMGFLTPELLRVLKPGRVVAVHVKDRIVPGGMTGLGFQTVEPFHCQTIAHFLANGFAYLGMKTIVTDVVRENNQTYRLGWSEQCKDGSRMGCGMPEYLLLFRKPPTDSSSGYADEPVVKGKPLCDDNGEPAPFDKKKNWKHPLPGTGYSRALWQFDAHGFMRSGGDRLLSSQEVLSLPHDQIYKLWRQRSENEVYDFAGHLAIAEDMDHARRLPASFMLLPPHSWSEHVWTDVTRMQTLNGAQHAAGREMHLCPLQFDIVDRAIVQLSNKGDVVFDPFGGLMTVPLRAVKLGRRGLGVELNAGYFADGVGYLRRADAELATPTLFDLVNEEAAE